MRVLANELGNLYLIVIPAQAGIQKQFDPGFPPRLDTCRGRLSHAGTTTIKSFNPCLALVARRIGNTRRLETGFAQAA